MSGNDIRPDWATDALAVLEMHEPDAHRAAKVRGRCHAALQKQGHSSRGAISAMPGPTWRRALEPAIVGSLCAGYLLLVLSRALQLYRL
jgi:hypothetical protein